MTDIANQFCGQEQPHPAHTWISQETPWMLAFEEQCGGHS